MNGAEKGKSILRATTSKAGDFVNGPVSFMNGAEKGKSIQRATTESSIRLKYPGLTPHQ